MLEYADNSEPVFIDNTVLTNFACVGQMALIKDVWGAAAQTTPAVKKEYQRGVHLGQVPPHDLDDLTSVKLTKEEMEDALGRFSHLGAGERTCLAVALHRRGLLATDDRPARKIAARLEIRITGTIGILVLAVVENKCTLAEANALLETMISLGYYAPTNRVDSFLPE